MSMTKEAALTKEATEALKHPKQEAKPGAENKQVGFMDKGQNKQKQNVQTQ